MNCIICDQHTDIRTCPGCLAHMRTTLTEIRALHGTLSMELAGHAGAGRPADIIGHTSNDGVPDALVMVAGGTAGGVIGVRSTRPDPTDRAHARDQWATDPPSVLAVLVSWEDDWRLRRYIPAAVTTTLDGTVDYLDRNLAWAAENHPAIGDFADEITTLLARLRHAARAGNAPQRGVPCLNCGHTLTRHYADARRCHHPRRLHGPWLIGTNTWVADLRTEPHCNHHDIDPRNWPCRGSNTCPCNQGGRRDTWICSNHACRRRYDPGEYTLAVWQHWDKQTTTS